MEQVLERSLSSKLLQKMDGEPPITSRSASVTELQQ